MIIYEYVNGFSFYNRNDRGPGMNIYDIAREAGVSIATVSRVINNKGYVSEKTRLKIQKVLDENGYQPSAIARGLVTGSMKTIAILAVDVRVPHYAMTVYIMESMLSEAGYSVMVCNTGEDSGKTLKYIQILVKKNVDGIILIGSIYRKLCTKEVLRLLGNIPVVMANGRIDKENFYSVLVDDGYGIGLAVRHMYETGHRKIAYVRDRQTESALRKQKGFEETLTSLGYEDPARHVFSTSYGLDGGRAAAEKILEHPHGYDAVVCGEDLTAVGVLYGVLDHGIRVPDQISVSGCNNSEYAMVCNPQLTSVNNKGEVLSRLSVELLRDILTGQKEPTELVILPELVVRQT